MPWREQSVMDQREEFVRLASIPGANKSELCRRFRISRSNGNKWLKRFLAEGRRGLADRSRRPRSSPKQTPQAVEAEVLRIRNESNNAWGGRKIERVMRKGDKFAAPVASTITEILRRHGKLEERRTEHSGPYRRFERSEPNELWQMDFKGHFPVGQGRCHPLTVLDDHSRYSLALSACSNEQDGTARERLETAFRRYGLPLSMLMDNGSPWGDSATQLYTAFTVWLMRLGVRVMHCRPCHPQTQGKDERFHRSLKAEVLSGKSFRDLAACQVAFDRWRHIYNHDRPHEALAFATPSERYRVSPREFPETLPPIEYACDDIVRRVDVGGDFSLKGRCVHIGKAFRGQPIALRATREGVLSVYFCAHHIGTLDMCQPACATAVDLWTTRGVLPTRPQPQQQQTLDT
jgi:transposase InsO family protein